VSQSANRSLANRSPVSASKTAKREAADKSSSTDHGKPQLRLRFPCTDLLLSVVMSVMSVSMQYYR
jgi:hypothetical protein